MIESWIDKNINYLDLIIEEEDEIDQYIESIYIINKIIKEEDFNIYWDNSIIIDINEIIKILNIIEFWDSDNSIMTKDWLRSSSF